MALKQASPFCCLAPATYQLPSPRLLSRPLVYRIPVAVGPSASVGAGQTIHTAAAAGAANDTCLHTAQTGTACAAMGTVSAGSWHARRIENAIAAFSHALRRAPTSPSRTIVPRLWQRVSCRPGRVGKNGKKVVAMSSPFYLQVPRGMPHMKESMANWPGLGVNRHSTSDPSFHLRVA